jgi:hypothetical protein
VGVRFPTTLDTRQVSGQADDGRPNRSTTQRHHRATPRGDIMTEQLHLGLNPVRSDRAEDFERFLVDVVLPAVRAQRPDLEGRWRVMRSSEPSGDVMTYVFMLEGGSLADDWELGVLLPAHYGEEEAERLITAWTETFAPLDAWAEAAVSSGRENNQLVWSMEPVALD